MFVLKFVIQHQFVSKFNDFVEIKDVQNCSVFENSDLGFSDDRDQDGFPIAKFFNVEIFCESEEIALNLRKSILNEKIFQENTTNFQINAIENEDWVSVYTKELKPVIIENFYIYNDNYNVFDNVTKELIPVKINSALAFGSGDHQTTKACIMMINYLNNIGFSPKKILDMGCGTGILSVCASKTWNNSDILGIDIEETAVKISNDNFKANSLTNALAIEGCNVNNLGDSFDLVLCNILKQPLKDLCEGFYNVMNTLGYVVTSGFISDQYKEISDHYKKNGFIEEKIMQENEWMSVLFRKPL